MSVVYITDQGSSISKKGDRLYVIKGRNVLRWIHTKDIDQLILLGNIALTAQCATYLLKNRIDTLFLTYYGKYKGRLVGEYGKNISLRVSQFRFLESNLNKFSLAKQYVRAKVENGITIMRKRNYRIKSERIKQAIMKNMAILKYNFDQIMTLEELRGYEGISAKNYFSIFPDLLKNDDFTFQGRNKRPPKDEVNALLSLGYTLLMSQVLGKVYIVGIDPYYGALHEIDYGRQSLVLDLMEEIRPLLDDLVLEMINRREIRKSHFAYNQIEDQEFNLENEEEQKFLPVSLTTEGMKKFIFKFSSLMNKKLYYERLNGNFSLNQIVLSQARRLAAHFEGKEQYIGFDLLKGIRNAKVLSDQF